MVPAPHVWMVAVPETAGVHWKTCSGEVPELPQLPASELVPLVVPLKVPPCAGMTGGLVHLPGSVVVVVESISASQRLSLRGEELPIVVVVPASTTLVESAQTTVGRCACV